MHVQEFAVMKLVLLCWYSADMAESQDKASEKVGLEVSFISVNEGSGTIVNSVVSAVLGEGAGYLMGDTYEKESGYEVNCIDNVGDCSSDEKCSG